LRLELRDASYSYGSAPILDAICLSAQSGEFVALMGSNGAGKSTLLDLIAGLRRPHAGTVKIDGRRLADWPARQLARRVSHLPQSVSADLPFQAEQLVAMGRYPYSENWHESEIDRQKIELAMQRANCLQFRHRRLTTLSGGERQRVLLAACLAQAAEALLLDEPSTFLDVDQQLRCFALLKEQAAGGSLCIAVTHDINLALAHCTRIVVLAGQGVAADISVKEAAATPDWLKLFSNRLQMSATPTGRPWVWFE
jgi:ABC-type cobalamin/Fe3+-siderophores transport system ATPase subunit